MTALALALPPRQVLGDSPDVLAEALRDGVNLAVWERQLPAAVGAFVDAVLASGGLVAETLSVELEEAAEAVDLQGLLAQHRDLPGHVAFVADVAWLVRAFACLLDARRVGIRLRMLDKAMCPRFHVDRLPLRLVTTYAGPATEWLAEGAMARNTLDSPAGEPRAEWIRSLAAGDVALLKGERWVGNEHGAIIHRSPPVADGTRRLLLTLDWLE